MDFHLKQWRNQQHESEQLQQQQEQPSAKIPKLLLDPQHQQNPSPPATSAALPLFLPEPNNNTNNTKISNLSAFPDSTTSPPATTRFTKMGSYFSLAQFQELELQALIYRYMLAGAAVPPELLQPIKKSLLLHSPSYFLHHPLQHYSFCQTPLLQTGYWGRGSMDPEPGRCRRTDGKKWRCSRDVVVGQKYCERHVHRGRNRSRKPVEIPTPTSTNPAASTTAVGGGSAGGGLAGSGATAHIAAASSLAAAMANGSSFTVPGQSPPIDLLHLNNNSCSESKAENKVLRHFFDDWPRSVQDSENGGNNASQMNSATSLSISMPGNGNSSSDVSLKLSTGVGEEPGRRGNSTRDQPQLNWGGGWGANQMSSMGGPLAEALRSSTSTSSPTSVLHQMPRRSASETSYIST